MNHRTAIRRHRKRLANLTEKQAVNLMVHAANETPLLAIKSFSESFVDVLTLQA